MVPKGIQFALPLSSQSLLKRFLAEQTAFESLAPHLVDYRLLDTKLLEVKGYLQEYFLGKLKADWEPNFSLIEPPSLEPLLTEDKGLLFRLRVD